MSQDNLGRAVKWQDRCPLDEMNDGAWHTGRVVEYPQIKGPTPHLSGEVAFEFGYASNTKCYILVRESCDDKLSWVDKRLLSDWQMRSEWEDEAEQQMVLNQIEHNYKQEHGTFELEI